MYIFKNAFKNISIFKTRNILMFIIIFILSLLCCLSLIFWQVAEKYEESSISSMRVSVDFGSDLSQADANSAFILYRGTNLYTSSNMSFNEEEKTLEELHQLLTFGNPVASYNLISTHLSGSENFKSYILDSNLAYTSLTKSKIAAAFFDHQYVNIVGPDSEQYLGDLVVRNFFIEEGEMFNNDTSKYTCVVSRELAQERNIKAGDIIQIHLNDLEYEIEVTGLYIASTSIFAQNLSTGKNVEFNLSSLGQLVNNSDHYFPIIYVNDSFYEEIKTKPGAGVDLGFNLMGFPSDESLVDFINGNKIISFGKVFDPSSDAYECIISEDLAKKNQVKVGDEIVLRGKLENSKDYPFKIVGVYRDVYKSNLDLSIGIYEIPLDTIYVSSPALLKLVNDIESYSDALYPTLSNLKLVFNSTKDMNSFYQNVIKYDHKLRGKFESASQNVNEYFNQLILIKRTTSYALITFIVELAVAIAFLLMFNAYNMKERQYEVGVLASMGMSKGRMALQFFLEIIIVVLTATLLGSALGTTASGTIGDYLTTEAVTSRETRRIALIESFGRDVNIPSLDNEQDSTIDASVDLTTLMWIWAAFVSVTIITTSGSISFILSFEPVSILNDI